MGARHSMRSWTIYSGVLLMTVLVLTLVVAPRSHAAALLLVPHDYPSVQAAINAAQSDDVVLVAPGTYHESLTIAGKTITVASHFFTTDDPAFVDQTIIDAGGAAAVVTLLPSAAGSRLIGLTLQNAEDGINLRTHAVITNNTIRQTTDGIDSTDGGGTITDNVFEYNRDDGIDFDKGSSGLIERNIIRNNDNDGIELRLHDYTGPQLTITIRGNVISGNKEDGIQLIDYPSITDRVFYIERNIIEGNTDVGIGLMDEGVTNEDYRGASIPERIHVYNNVISGNPYAITGGDNLIAVNNIFAHSSVLALKNVDARSVAAYNLFWNNRANELNSNVDRATTIEADPVFADGFTLRQGSPAIDRGTARYVHEGQTVLDYAPEAYAGVAPDLGWWEHPIAPAPTPTATVDPPPTPTETPLPAPTATATMTPTATALPVPLQTLERQPVADTYVSAAYPRAKYGRANTLRTDTTPIEESFMRFEIGAIPGSVVSATLQLYATNGSSAANGTIMLLTSVTWSEDGLNYNRRPPLDGHPVCTFDHVPDHTWLACDVTAAIHGADAYSFALSQRGVDGVAFTSRERKAENLRPRLVITYAPDRIAAP